jgi:large subunit ribosomal protein L3
MNTNALIGKKIDQTQAFLENGIRVPLTVVSMAPNIVSQIKTQEHDGYMAVQLGIGHNTKAKKSKVGHATKAGIEKTPRFFKEVRVESVEGFELAGAIAAGDVFKPGDIIDVIGTSKGKGYAGVVKRHNFRGGPRTHGQSDRERAPGSSGQTTTPGRVYKGKRMSGRMGNEQVTVKNLLVLDVQGDTLLVKGLLPGPKGTMIRVTKVGEKKKFIPLFVQPSDQPVEEPVAEEAPAEELAPSAGEIKQEVKAEVKEVQVEEKEAAKSEDDKALDKDTKKDLEDKPSVAEGKADKKE